MCGSATSRPVTSIPQRVPGTHGTRCKETREEPQVIILGIVLIVVTLVATIPILETSGVVLLVIGAALWVLGSMGRAVGGRKHYY